MYGKKAKNIVMITKRKPIWSGHIMFKVDDRFTSKISECVLRNYESQGREKNRI